MQEHFDDVQEVFCGSMPDESCAIGSDEDQRRLVEEQEEMSTTVNSLLDQTKVRVAGEGNPFGVQ